MGRYRNTVTCRYCYDQGHNIKSCQKLANDVKANPDGYTASRYSKYFNPDGTKKSASQTRKCSYCKEPGHTKRDCDVRIGDMVSNISTNISFRKNFYELLKKNGLGVGSLVTIYDNMYLVTSINWENFICGFSDWSRQHLSIESVSGGGHRSFNIEDYYLRGDRINSCITVESPSEVEEPPSKWFEGKSDFYQDFRGRVKNPFNFSY